MTPAEKERAFLADVQFALYEIMSRTCRRQSKHKDIHQAVRAAWAISLEKQIRSLVSRKTKTKAKAT